jgi:hypothetical protein
MESVWILTKTHGWHETIGVYTTESNAKIAEFRAMKDFMLEHPDCEHPDIYFYIAEQRLDDEFILNYEYQGA